jgi:uncharacterized Zn finger protein
VRCPKCKNETFKARVIRRQRIKEYPHLIPVVLQCDKCGHNIRVYISREDLKFIRDKLTVILDEIDSLKGYGEEFQKLIKRKPEKRKSFFERFRK